MVKKILKFSFEKIAVKNISVSSQLYTVIEACKNATDGGDGIEWVENKPFHNILHVGRSFTSGQYTRKIYHIGNKLPRYVRCLLPEKSRSAIEEAWNAFPYCKIKYKPVFSDRLDMRIESIRLSDRGEADNALNLTPAQLAHRQVILVDILNDPVDPKDYKTSDDPAKFRSKILDRKPLQGTKTCEPHLCCYKVSFVECSWLVFGRLIESFILKQYPRLFVWLQRQLYCSIDQWYGLTQSKIRKLEYESIEILNKQIREGSIRGVTAVDWKLKIKPFLIYWSSSVQYHIIQFPRKLVNFFTYFSYTDCVFTTCIKNFFFSLSQSKF